MQPKRTNNYDSIKEYYAGYRDSVVVDYSYSVAEGFTPIWLHKDADKKLAKASDFDKLSHETQYYIVPTFFAIIIAFFIFGSLVMSDNSKAEKENKRESLLDFLNNK